MAEGGRVGLMARVVGVLVIWLWMGVCAACLGFVVFFLGGFRFVSLDGSVWLGVLGAKGWMGWKGREGCFSSRGGRLSDSFRC